MDGTTLQVSETHFIDELMEELSEFFPSTHEMTSYYLDLTAADKIDSKDDSGDFIEIECTEGIHHKRFFAVLGPESCCTDNFTSLEGI